MGVQLWLKMQPQLRLQIRAQSLTPCSVMQVGALLGPELGSADSPSLEGWLEDLKEAALAAAQGLETAKAWLRQVGTLAQRPEPG